MKFKLFTYHIPDSHLADSIAHLSLFVPCCYYRVTPSLLHQTLHRVGVELDLIPGSNSRCLLRTLVTRDETRVQRQDFCIFLRSPSTLYP